MVQILFFLFGVYFALGAGPAFAESPFVKKSISEVTRATQNSITFKLSPEVALSPGDVISFSLPAVFAERELVMVILGHRQDPSSHLGSSSNSNHDSQPGLSSVEIHSSGFKNECSWRCWGGSSSGVCGAKFAEPRHSPEIENLYGWRKVGHQSKACSDLSSAPLYVDQARITNVGTDKVLISEITFKNALPASTATIDAVFSPGTSFANRGSGDETIYGGGQAYQGVFPNALALGLNSSSQPALPEGWRIEGSYLYMPLPAGKIFSGIDVALGDSHPDKMINKDGGYGTPGWAKISIGTKLKNENIIWFVDSDNIGPQQTTTGMHLDKSHRIQNEEELVLKISSDTAYIMAIRIHFND